MAEAWPRIPVTLRWVRLCVCEGSYRVYRWRGAHQSGGANRGGGAGSDPDTRDHQRPGEHLHTHTCAHSWSEKHVWAMHKKNLISLCFKPKCQTHLMAAAVQTWGFAAFLCLCPCILNIFVFSAVAQKKTVIAKMYSWAFFQWFSDILYTKLWSKL